MRTFVLLEVQAAPWEWQDDLSTHTVMLSACSSQTPAIPQSAFSGINYLDTTDKET